MTMRAGTLSDLKARLLHADEQPHQTLRTNVLGGSIALGGRDKGPGWPCHI